MNLEFIVDECVLTMMFLDLQRICRELTASRYGARLGEFLCPCGPCWLRMSCVHLFYLVT